MKMSRDKDQKAKKSAQKEISRDNDQKICV